MTDPIRILIVEDLATDADLAIREVRKSLEACVFQRVETERDYLGALEEFVPDLILSDYQLPQFTGLQALKLVQKCAPLTPLIIMTGSVNEDTAVACMKAGATDYIIKENIKRLGTAVVRALEEKKVRLQQNLAEAERRDIEERYHNALNNLIEGCQIVDFDWRYVYVNSTAAEQGRKTPETLLMRTMMDVYPGIEDTELFRHLRLSMDERIPVRIENQFFFGDGTFGWFDLRIQPVPEGIFILSIDITERKRGEEKLRENEQKFRSVFENSPLGKSLTGIDGSMKVNQAFCDILGYTEEELQAGSWKNITHPDDLQKSLDASQALLEGRSSRAHFEKRYIRKDGNVVWAEITIVLQRDETGQPLYFLTTINDITERKQAEAALRASEARFRGLFEDSPISLWEEDFSGVTRRLDAWRAEGVTDFQEYFTLHPEAVSECAALVKVLDVNKATLGLLGANRQEELFGSLAKILDRPAEDPFRDQLLAIAARKTSFHSESVNKTLDGRLLNIDLHWSVVPGFEDTFSNVIVSLMDITERKNAEQALRESVSVFDGFLEQSEDAVMLTDEQGILTHWSRGAERLTGYSRDETIGKPLWDVQFRSAPAEHKAAEHYQNLRVALQMALLTGQGPFINRLVESVVEHPDGLRLTVQTSAFSIQTTKGFLLGGILRDMTERKQAEEKLQEERILLRTLIDNLPDRVYVMDREGRKIVSNMADWQAAGVKAMEEVIGKTDLDNYPPELREEYWAVDQQVLNFGTAVIDHEEPAMDPQGNPAWILSSKVPLRDSRGKVTGLVGIGRDITERKRAEQTLLERDQRFRALIENSSDAITLLDPQGIVLYDSPSAPGLLGYGAQDWLGRNVFELIHPDDLPEIQGLLQTIVQTRGARVNTTFRIRHKGGAWLWLEAVATNLLDEPAVKAIVVNYRDITERKRAQAERQALLEIMQAATLTDKLPEFLELLRQSLGRVIYAENFFVVFHDNRTGLFEEVFAVDKCDEPMPPSMLEKSITSYVYRTGEPLLLTQTRFAELMARGEVELVGAQQASWLGVPIKTPAETIGVIAVQHYEDPDCYSERDRAFLASIGGQVALAIQRKQAEEKLRQSEERFRRYFELGLIGMAITSPTKGILEANDQMCSMLGYDRDELLRIAWSDITHPDDLAADTAEFNRVLAGEIDGYSIEKRWIHKDGHIVYSSISVKCLRRPDGSVDYFVALLEDITGRKRAEARIEKQVRRLSALRAIDTAISSSLDMRVSFNILLAQTINELHVDAAAVLTFNSLSNEMEYAAGVGFRGRGIAGLRLKLGEGYAGQAALERRTISVPNLADSARSLARPEVIAEEKFVVFYAVPLIAKGHVKGVLELFHRSRLNPDPEWLDFLETLAGQAAIAIDSAQLFADLQRSNMELALAYDSTIEGWSQAMDLRDKETEGHTLRVTEGALKLGRALGLSEEELMHLRRGALLHDIGKMGVPDTVLLKPGPLTEEEWVLMRQHPTLAYQMLAQVRYLQPAINIPYCHHEKWDGSGYPRGLKGEQIPLVARLFAVIDVYDAVTSDRPYRAAWSQEKAQEYILSESGKQFDPSVVKVFLEMKAAERRR